MSGIVLTDAPSVALPPLTKAEAEAISAMEGVLKRYRLVEWIRCERCYQAHRMDGLRTVVNSRTVRLQCRCGVREYTAPQGTTDLHANRANSSLGTLNQGEITVITASGEAKKLIAMRIEPEDAAIIRLYSRIMGALSLNPKLAHRDCWDHRPYDESACELLCDDSKIAIKCGCRVLHYSGSSSVN